ncbi:hypothetical protein [Nocardiopsis salina]|uniref:hypothetical protein n=1 Tax=Nocardiopsis salina TaxID=245836 RepID=UPI000347DE46|nr:hypothetical protein [Nocardiopsis salina]
MPTEKRRSTPDTTEEVSPTPAGRSAWWLSGGAIVAVGAVVAAVVFHFAGDDEVTPDAGRVAELEASAGERDLEQVEELVHHTRAAHEELLPLVESLDEVVPTDGSETGRDDPGPDELEGWLETAEEAGGHFDDVPSGETDYNIAHAGLANSVDLLGSSVAAYANALEAEDDGLREDMAELAGDLRTQAVQSWSVAATQLDVLSIDAGHGHVHLYLPAAPGSGALEPDPAEDGDGAVEGGGHDH